MLHNGLHLAREERAPLRVVVERCELADKHRTPPYPAVEGLHGALGSTAWLVEQSQFGLAIGTWLKHIFKDLTVIE